MFSCLLKKINACLITGRKSKTLLWKEDNATHVSEEMKESFHHYAWFNLYQISWSQTSHTHTYTQNIYIYIYIYIYTN